MTQIAQARPVIRTFFGSDSFFEADEPNIGARRVVLLLVLLGVLGAGGWWAYTHYNKIGAIIATYSGTNSQPSATQPGGTETTANNPAPNQKPSDQKSSNQKSTTEPAAPSSPEVIPSQPAATPPAQSGAAESKTPNTAPAASEKSTDENATQTPPAAAKPAEPSHPSRTQNVVHARRNDTREARNRAAPPPKAAARRGR